MSAGAIALLVLPEHTTVSFVKCESVDWYRPWVCLGLKGSCSANGLATPHGGLGWSDLQH